MNPREPTTTAPRTESSDEKECAPVVELVPTRETKLERRKKALDAVIDRNARRAARHIEGLLAPGPEGDRDARDETMRDKAAFEVYRGHLRSKKDDQHVIHDLGIVVVKAELSAGDWEKHAQDVDAKLREQRVIDVEPKK